MKSKSLKNQILSIIIVNRNGERWLKRCLNSLNNQTYKKFEIIVIDNASLDSSVQLIHSLFPSVKVISNTSNIGFARANNIGISNSNGEIILLLNTDIWVNSTFIEDIYRYYRKNNFDIVAPIVRDYYSQDLIDIPNIDPLGNPACHPASYNRKKILYLGGEALLFSKSFYKETHGFDEDFFMYYEDVDWFWRLNLLGKTYSFTDNIFVYHAGAGSNNGIMTSDLFLWKNQNTLQMLIKNYSTIMLMIILPLYFVQNIFEMCFFTIIFKSKITITYINSWIFFLKHIKNVLLKRRWIQKNRVIPDYKIIQKMFLGSGKIQILGKYLFSKI